MKILKMRDNNGINGLWSLIVNNLLDKSNLIGIEIGSYAGESTELFLKSYAFKTLYCIDPWKEGYDDKDDASYTDMNYVESIFDSKFANNPTIIKVKQSSNNAVNMFEDNSIDFVYIDGCHTYEAVKWDVEHYITKIKDGGVIAGHDYGAGHLPGVKKAIDEYFKDKISQFTFYSDNSWAYTIKR